MFRPFAGDINHVKESFWFALNTGEDFRAKTFKDISYRSSVEAAGPIYSSLVVNGNLVTLNTTEYPPAWVVARAVLYRTLKRVDVLTELHTYPQMGFLAFAELEPGMGQFRVFRDFPLGEEETNKSEFSALNYVRMESEGLAIVLAHGGTQQFFKEDRKQGAVLRNMIARETLKGVYRWRWSITTGPSFTPADCYHFAESLSGAVIDHTSAPINSVPPLVSVDDPAIVVFRFGRQPRKTIAWLANYSDRERKCRLEFSKAYQSAHRTDLEGNRIIKEPPGFSLRGKTLDIDRLRGWEIASVELLGG